MKILITLIALFLTKSLNAQTLTIIPNLITDGDTFKAGNQTYRLATIDAPELQQPYGITARNKLDSLIKNKPIQIIQLGKDKFGRTLCNAKINNKRIDSIAIRNGWAWHYKEFSNDYILQQMQIFAQSNKLGLFSTRCQPAMYPQEFRKLKAKTRKIYIDNPACP